MEDPLYSPEIRISSFGKWRLRIDIPIIALSALVDRVFFFSDIKFRKATVSFMLTGHTKNEKEEVAGNNHEGVGDYQTPQVTELQAQLWRDVAS